MGSGRRLARLTFVLWTLAYVTMGAARPAAADDPSPALSPSRLKLPKGPGSLEGVGENAEANLNQGQVSYAVPFALPAGQQGLTPNLGLHYSSTGGASVVGMGFSIGTLPSIERMTVRGLPHFDATDLFVTDGGAELARVSGGTSTQRIYRERFEGSFVRYTWVDAAGTGADGYWKAEYPDGRVGYFGARADGTTVPESRLLGRGGRTFAYHLVELVDPYGHRVVYDYVKDGGRPYVVTIRWGYEGSTPRYTVELVYEARPDVLPDGKPGALVQLSQRLRDVVVRVGGSQLRRYALEYESTTQSGGLSRLARVRTFGTDDATANPIEFRFAYTPRLDPTCATTSSGSCVRPRRVTLGSIGADLRTGDVDFVDMNGDGLPDAVDTRSGVHHIWVHQMQADGGHGFAAVFASTVAGSGAMALSSSEVEAFDIDGDARVDLVDGLNDHVLRNAGTNGDWSASDTTALHVPRLSTDADLRFMDVDYDRRTDLIHLSSSGAWYFRNNGATGFATTATDVAGLAKGFTSDGLRLSDMNGDGMVDAVQFVVGGGVWYYPNLGYGEFASAVAMANVPAGWDPTNTELVDLDGDGLTDLVQVLGTQVAYALNQDASSYGAVVQVQSSNVAGGLPLRTPEVSVRFLDMTANGTTDIVWVSSSGLVEFVELSATRPNLLVRVDNGIGKRIRLAYDTVYQQLARDGGLGAWARTLPNPMVVLSSISLEDTRSGVVQQQVLSYRNGYWDGEEHQFRGFEEVWVRTPGDTHVETGEVLHTFDVGVSDRYHRGLPLRVETRSNGRVLSVGTSEWTDCSVAQASALGTLPVRFVCSTRQVTDLVEGLDASATVRTEEDYQYDGYGNRIVVHKLGVVSRGGAACGACARDASVQGEPCGPLCSGDEQHEIQEFIVPGSATAGRWILHAPYRKRTFGIDGGPDVAEERTYYDGADFVGQALGTLTLGAVHRVEQRRAAATDAWLPAQRFATDAHGNVTSALDPNGHRRTFAYDSAGLLVKHEQVELDDPGHAPYALRMEVSYHPVLEQVVSSTAWMRVEGGNPVTSPRSTAYGYDVLGRITAIAEPGDSLAAPTQEFVYELADPVSRIVTRRRTASGSGSADLEAVQCFDGLGRKFQERVRIESGRYQVSGHQAFDAHGQVWRQYQPYLGSTGDCDAQPPAAGVRYTDTQRDAANRTLAVTHPDAETYGGTASIERTEYRPLEVVAWDGEDTDGSSPHANTPTRVVNDGLGRLLRQERLLVGEANPVTIAVTYDSLGRIRSLLDDAGNEQSQSYDLLGRILEVHHPDSGVTKYTYDDANNLLSRTDARGVVTRHAYDEANRIVATWDDARSQASLVSYRYDGDCIGGPVACPNGEGQLVEVSHPLLAGQLGRERTLRDVRGREVGRVVERGNRTYAFSNAYDNADRPVGRTFPDGTTLTFSLDGAGRLTGVPGYVNEIAYDARGQASRTAFGNGVVTTSTYDARLRLGSLTTKLPTGPDAQSLAYDWDRAGNLRGIDDHREVSRELPSETARYEYDSLYRLTTARLDAGRKAEETLAYTYDRIDNLRGIVSSRGTASAAHVGELRYGELGAGPHAVTTVGDDVYAYDAAGQVTDRLGLHHEWDYQGRLARTTRMDEGASSPDPELVTETAYGADWTRTEQASKGSASEYVAPDYEVRNGIATIYVRSGEKTLARIERSGPAAKEMPDLAPASERGSTLAASQDGKIDAADAWLWQAKAEGLADVDLGSTPVPSGRQVDVDVMLAEAASRLLLGDDAVAVTYEHGDHLGTVTVETDEEGVVTQRAQAYPYGTPRYEEGTGWSRHGYTGMERDRGTGLQLHGARWLDTRAGRWMRADPLFERLPSDIGRSSLADMAAPYTYALGSPIGFTDVAGTLSDAAIESIKIGVGVGMFAVGVAACVVAAPVAGVGAGAAALFGVAAGVVSGGLSVYSHPERTAGEHLIAGGLGAVAAAAGMVTNSLPVLVGLTEGQGLAFAGVTMAIGAGMSAIVDKLIDGLHQATPAAPAAPSAPPGGASPSSADSTPAAADASVADGGVGSADASSGATGSADGGTGDGPGADMDAGRMYINGVDSGPGDVVDVH